MADARAVQWVYLWAGELADEKAGQWVDGTVVK